MQPEIVYEISKNLDTYEKTIRPDPDDTTACLAAPLFGGAAGVRCRSARRSAPPCARQWMQRRRRRRSRRGETVQDLARLRQPLGVERVIRPATLLPVGHEASVLQDLQVK